MKAGSSHVIYFIVCYIANERLPRPNCQQTRLDSRVCGRIEGIGYVGINKRTTNRLFRTPNFVMRASCYFHYFPRSRDVSRLSNRLRFA